MPKHASQSPIEGDCRPRPPVKERSVAFVLDNTGVERKMGKMCMNAELWRGSRPKEINVTSTSRVQILRNGGLGRGAAGLGMVTTTVSSAWVGGKSSSFTAVYSVVSRAERFRKTRSLIYRTNHCPIRIPWSLSSSFPGSVSLSPRIARMRLMPRAIALIMTGSAYGYFSVQATPPSFLPTFSRPFGPNSQAILITGSAKQPPKASPATMPELNTKGRIKNALVWYFLSFTISAVIVLITPVFPFPSPAKTLQKNNAATLLENPKAMFAITLASNPIVIIDFRPYISDSLPQSMLVAN